MRRREEAGSLSIWTSVMGVVFLMMLTLVIDGGGIMSTERQASRIAEQAARVGADQLDLDSVRTGGSDVNAGAAVTAANRHLSAAGERGRVRVAGDQVTVTVTKTYRPKILSAVGMSSRAVEATAAAVSIDGPDDGPG